MRSDSTEIASENGRAIICQPIATLILIDQGIINRRGKTAHPYGGAMRHRCATGNIATVFVTARPSTQLVLLDGSRQWPLNERRRR